VSNELVFVGANGISSGPGATVSQSSIYSRPAGASSYGRLTIISAALRARIPTGLASVSANNYTSTRVRENTNYDIINPWPEYFNGWVDVSSYSVVQEKANGNPISICASFETNTDGGVTLNQATAIITRCTWANAAACVAGYIWKLDGTTPTAAEFAAASGGISGDTYSITVPAGYRVRADNPSGLLLPRRTQYYFKLEDSAPIPTSVTVSAATNTYTAGQAIAVTGGLPLSDRTYLVSGTGVTGGTTGTYSGGDLTLSASATITNGQTITLTNRRPTSGVLQSGGTTGLGDTTKLAATAQTMVFTTNWNVGGVGSTSGNTIAHACDIFGYGPAGAKCVSLIGDSIQEGNFDRITSGDVGAYGDADRVQGAAGGALNLVGYSFTRCAVSGTRPSTEVIYGGNAQRKLSCRFSSTIFVGAPHNDRSTPWLGSSSQGTQASPGTFNGMLSGMRIYWQAYRAAGLNGNARIVAMDMLRQASSTDNWATTLNQTSTSGPGTTQYDSYNPLIAAGSFTPTLGDPDAGISVDAMIDAVAVSIGLTDTATNKWPCNNVAKAGANDSTHPTHIVHQAIVPPIAALLPAKIGF
jgi:hypothetical protein